MYSQISLILFRLVGGFQKPVSSPARMLAASWWATGIVMYAIYTGNLIAFLTVTHRKMPFNSLEAMVEQSVYSYGVEKGIIQEMLFRVCTGFPSIII